MANDSIELGRIRAKVLRLEDKTDRLTIVDTTASFNQSVNISGNLYINGEEINISSLDVSSSITSALIPYASSINVSSSVSGALGLYSTSTGVSSSITAALSPYATSANVSSSVTSALGSYATSANVSSSVTSSINALKGDLTASYARLATTNTFTANQTITGTLSISSHITGNGNLYISGNVGIGTTTPSSPLHLKSTGPIQFIIEADTDNATESDNANIILKQDGGAVQAEIGMFDAENILRINNMYSDALWLGTSDTARLYIDSTGSVGIGTTAALEKLHVVGNTIIGSSINSANGYPSSDLIIHANDATSALGQVEAISIFRQQSANSWPQIATMTIGRYELASTNPRTRLDFNLKHVADGTDTAEVNVMTLNSNGNVGIGTTAPSLQGSGTGLSIVGNQYIQLQVSGTSAGGIQFNCNNGDQYEIQADNNDAFFIYNRTDGAYRLYIDTTGSVGINTTVPTQMLDVNGTVRVRSFSATAAAGTVYRLTDGTLSLTAPSDIRFKKDVSSIENALTKIKSIRGVRFKWDDTQVPQGDFGIDESLRDKYRIGVIAQEIKDHIPEVIFKHQEGKDYLAVSYPEISAVLIEAIKELAQKNDYLDKKLEEKDEQIKDILLRLSSLENK